LNYFIEILCVVKDGVLEGCLTAADEQYNGHSGVCERLVDRFITDSSKSRKKGSLEDKIWRKWFFRGQNLMEMVL
jgi:hypothetical protein